MDLAEGDIGSPWC